MEPQGIQGIQESGQRFECGICPFVGLMMEMILHVYENHNQDGACIDIYSVTEGQQVTDE